MLKVEKLFWSPNASSYTKLPTFFPAAICNKNNHNLAFRNLNLDTQLGSAVGESLHTGFSIIFGSCSLTDNPTGTPSSVQLFHIMYVAICTLCMLTAKCNILSFIILVQIEALYVYMFFFLRHKKEASPLVQMCNQNIPNSSAAMRGCHIILTWFDCDPELGDLKPASCS